MARQKYAMNPGEKIVYKTSQVRHGFGDQYKHTLTITNQSVIWEKYGPFNQFRGIEQFDYSHIRQAVVGKSPSGRKRLDLYIGDYIETFALQSADEAELNVLAIAINDQIDSSAEIHDINDYQNLLVEAKATGRLLTLREKPQPIQEILGAAMGAAVGSALGIAGEAAKKLPDPDEEAEIPREMEDSKISVKEQIELLHKLKGLLDAELIAREEFQQKSGKFWGSDAGSAKKAVNPNG